MALHFVFCPRCSEQKQVQAIAGQKSVACPACRLPLLLHRPAAPLVAPEAMTFEDLPGHSNPSQSQVPFPTQLTARDRQSSNWAIKSMFGAILVLALAAIALGVFVIVQKNSVPGVAGQPAPPSLPSGSGIESSELPLAPSRPSVNSGVTGSASNEMPEAAPMAGMDSLEITPTESSPPSPEAPQGSLKPLEERKGQADAEQDKARPLPDQTE